MNITRTTRVLAALSISALALTACGNNDDPLSSGGGESNGDTNSIVVGSANFPESETVANIYAEALRANGFDVGTKFNIGSREAYIPAVKDGSIDLVPDYTGNLLQYLDESATATSSEDVLAALPDALGSDLAVTAQAPGEDKDAVVVSRSTATERKLTTIGDLAPFSADVTFAGTPEFQERVGGLPGLSSKYGLDIAAGNYVPISDGGGPATVEALVSGKVTAADIFTTSPAIAQNDLVVLEDPENNFAAQNIIPVLNTAKQSDKLTKVLDAVSAQITTEELIALNTSVSGDAKVEPAAAAKAWVAQKGLDKPIS
ncbi:ABC transporter substrate-binding protein [Rhodococcus sp. PAMC28707]|uniref:ABC transporter substrate-binding protein n=1 Tax=unclassified Rhodococcus (in: high G+C Gram-positive bacteria) TaxID=192944 RepID=UPI00109E063A|nr:MULTISPECIES: ABC transporter substrate-binding protein [unclassified Rhodococcus (in: high G+C Gram-positive bacteria)]QCB52196.1 ABC transporter substrate-binding protein [Rhodococcus sp. PAMC28705]QCB59633.1 ABC transporter substrate-binding protein [Rhodococcus sp. PAMC28707]